MRTTPEPVPFPLGDGPARLARRAPCGKTTPLTVPGPGRTATRFPLGVHLDDSTVAHWDLEATAHALITGPAGAGKSATLRSIISHSRWHGRYVAIIDLTGHLEHSWAEGLDGVIEVATGRDRAIDLIERLTTPDQGRPALLLVDGAELLLSSDRAAAALYLLARVGPSVGVNLALTAQQPTAVAPETRALLDHRIYLGATTSATASVVLGTDTLPTLGPGRGHARAGDNPVRPIHAYWSPAPDDLRP